MLKIEYVYVVELDGFAMRYSLVMLTETAPLGLDTTVSIVFHI